MRGRFARDLVRAGRADASPPGARARALAKLGLQSGSQGLARVASGAALVALLALVLGWGPCASQPTATTTPLDHAAQCTDAIEAPPCADAGVRLATGREAPVAPTGSSGSGGWSGRSSG